MNAGLFSPDVLISDVRFRAERQFELGRGSDAVVYGGTWHGAPVAAKLLHEELLDPSNVPEGREALLTRFDQECQRLRRLRHPNIVQFLGVSRTRRDIPVLVTERMHASLLARYKGRPPLTPLLQFGLLRDTASGLSYIHSQHIVHRDLTPKNVLVTKDGRAKVADVGVARSLHGDRLGEAGMTQAPGTILYMPPEALVPQPVYDEQLDVFSYGVLMMSVILKREPPGDLLFSRRDEFGPDGRVHIIPEAARRAKDLRDIGRDHRLFGAINRCLENAPARRPSSSELFEELERLYCREEEATTTETGASSGTVSDGEMTILQAERDRLLRDKEDLSRQRDDALQQQRELTERLEDITQQCDTSLQQQQGLMQRLEDTTRQRNDALQQRDDALQQQQGLIQRLEDTTPQCNTAQQQRQVLIRQLEDTTQQRDDALQELQDLTGHLQEVSQRLNDMTRQRNNSLQLQENLLQEQQQLRETTDQHNRMVRRLQEEHRRAAARVTAESLAAARFNISLNEYQKLVTSHTSRSGEVGLFGKRMQRPLMFDDKWKTASSIERLAKGNKISVVQALEYRSHLFASAIIDGRKHIYQTSDLHHWNKVDVDWFLPNLDYRTFQVQDSRFVIHQDQIYRVLFCFFSEKNVTVVFILHFNFTDKDCSAAKLEFVTVSGFQFSHDSFTDTVFAVGDSIVLAGETTCDRTQTYPTVVEFNKRTKQWRKNSRWPNLPEPVAESIPIVTGDKVHLIGGVIISPGATKFGVSKVFTMNLVDSQPVGDWHTDDIPEIPHARCGAVQFHNHIIVAGGRHPSYATNPNSFHDKCYALEPTRMSWLPLPSLPYACDAIRLAIFQDFLVAVGGRIGVEWTNKVNTWHIHQS